LVKIEEYIILQARCGNKNRGTIKMFRNKKGQLISALNELPAAIIVFVVFAIVAVVGFKILGALYNQETNAGIQSNITQFTIALSNFTTNAGLLAVIVVMAIVLMVVISAFSFRRSEL
jgi:hypothetical protein